MNALRRASFNPRLRAFIRGLGLSALSQQVYFWMFHRGDSVTLHSGGVTAKFVSENYGDLRSMEGWTLEAPLEKLIGLVRPDDVVWDIGANRGVYSVLLAHKAKRVIAFEPEDISANLLVRNTMLNELSNVDLHRVALGASASTETLYLGFGVAAIDTGHIEEERKRSGRQQIQIVRGDDYLKEKGLPAPTVLKIDVEGYEGEVLSGLEHVLPGCRVLLCEIHPRVLPAGTTVETVLDRIKSAGFRNIELDRHNTEMHALAER